MRRALLLPAVLLLAACGAQASVSNSVQATRGNLTLSATPARLAVGQTVHLLVTVSGPTDYEAGCAPTVELWALDSAGQTAWAQPVPQVMCLAIVPTHLDGGQTASFPITWETSRQLAPGGYTVHGLFRFANLTGASYAFPPENLPVVSVEITG